MVRHNSKQIHGCRLTLKIAKNEQVVGCSNIQMRGCRLAKIEDRKYKTDRRTDWSDAIVDICAVVD